MKKILFMSFAVLLLSGCGLYTKYERPDVNTEGLVRDPLNPNDTLSLGKVVDGQWTAVNGQDENFGNMPWRSVFTDPKLQARAFIGTYQRFNSIKINASKATVRKGERGVLSISQFKPENPSNPGVTWEASSDDVKLALLPAGVKVSELSESDFTDGFVRTDLSKGESLAYLCVNATKKCVISAMTDDGTKKKVSCTLNIKGRVSKLEIKTSDKVVGENGHYTVRLKPSETLKLEVLMDAEYGAETKLIWSSDTPSVAKVKNGKISVCKEPEYDCCLITAMTADETRKIEVKLYVER